MTFISNSKSNSFLPILFFFLVLAILSFTSARNCQCTDYVAERFQLGNSGWGDALNWGPFLRGRAFSESDTPSVGAIVVQQPCFAHGVNQQYGHVGVVQAWNGARFSITGANQHRCELGTTSWNSGCHGAADSTCENISDWYGLPLVPGCVKFYTRGGGVTPTVPPAPAPPSSAAAYKGCFEDRSERDLSGPRTSSDSMTISTCRSFCRTQGYTYAGLQYAAECFCDYDYGAYARVGDGECSMSCRGNGAERCGNAWRNSVYSTAEDASPAAAPPSPAVPAPAPSAAPSTGLCTTSGLNLRSCASTACSIRTTIPYGKRVQDLGASMSFAGGMWWRYISYNGMTGYSANDYISPCAYIRLEADAASHNSRAAIGSEGMPQSGPPRWLAPLCVLAALALIAVVLFALVLLLVVLPRRQAQHAEQRQQTKILFEAVLEPPAGYRNSFNVSG